jgi:hypothetical protein
MSTKTAKKTASKPAAKPAKKTASKPAAKPAKKTASKPAAKPARKPLFKIDGGKTRLEAACNYLQENYGQSVKIQMGVELADNIWLAKCSVTNSNSEQAFLALIGCPRVISDTPENIDVFMNMIEEVKKSLPPSLFTITTGQSLNESLSTIQDKLNEVLVKYGFPAQNFTANGAPVKFGTKSSGATSAVPFVPKTIEELKEGVFLQIPLLKNLIGFEPIEILFGPDEDAVNEAVILQVETKPNTRNNTVYLLTVGYGISTVLYCVSDGNPSNAMATQSESIARLHFDALVSSNGRN